MNAGASLLGSPRETQLPSRSRSSRPTSRLGHWTDSNGICRNRLERTIVKVEGFASRWALRLRSYGAQILIACGSYCLLPLTPRLVCYQMLFCMSKLQKSSPLMVNVGLAAPLASPLARSKLSVTDETALL